MTDQEQKEWDLKLRKLDAEISNLNASTSKMNVERFAYPFVAGSAFFAAAIAISKLVLT